jgi:hypothetical protein
MTNTGDVLGAIRVCRLSRAVEVSGDRKALTPRTGRMILACSMKYSMSDISASGSWSRGGDVPLVRPERWASVLGQAFTHIVPLADVGQSAAEGLRIVSEQYVHTGGRSPGGE